METNKLNSILNSGILVAILTKDGKEARLYAHAESRGYQTSYTHKEFMYFVPYSINGIPQSFTGITRDSRRKDFIARVVARGSKVSIIDNKRFNKWVA